MKNIFNRIKELEQNKFKCSVPGTIIARCLIDNGIGWSVSFGQMNQPKYHFIGNSLEDAVNKAELFNLKNK